LWIREDENDLMATIARVTGVTSDRAVLALVANLCTERPHKCLLTLLSTNSIYHSRGLAYMYTAEVWLTCVPQNSGPCKLAAPPVCPFLGHATCSRFTDMPLVGPGRWAQCETDHASLSAGHPKRCVYQELEVWLRPVNYSRLRSSAMFLP